MVQRAGEVRSVHRVLPSTYPCGAWQADVVLGTRDEDPETGLPALRWVRKDELDVHALSSSVKKVYALAQAAGASAG